MLSRTTLIFITPNLLACILCNFLSNSEVQYARFELSYTSMCWLRVTPMRELIGFNFALND